jgi:hypothetical protein
MSIQPPSDIVMDVAQAADPARSQAATRRLMAYAAGDEPGPFGALVTPTSRPMGPAMSPEATLARLASGGRPASAGSQGTGVHNAGGAQRDLESFFLQTVFDTMMPKQSGALFGTGTAGSVWKSMLAEQLARQVTASGGLGILDPHDPSDGAARARRS